MAITLSKFGKQARRTLRLSAAWLAVSVFTALFEHLSLVQQGIVLPYSGILAEHALRAFFGGLIIGGIYVFACHDLMRKWSLLRSLAVVGAWLLAGLAGLYAFRSGMSSLPTLAFVGEFLHWFLLLAASILMLRLNDRYGGGDMDYLLDRFRRPRQELRIFMFLDMRSSTSIAESIGDTRYFQLLNDIYSDLTDPVVYSEGEIYQYVGDEISISWKLDRGTRNERCIRCFFAIREKLIARASHYIAQYGASPVFKAGLHFGPVTRGQVGLVKRQTIFSGDVVNTAAHIQASCNGLGVDNLVSKDLLDVLELSSQKYKIRPMGSIPLKGKRNAMELFSIELATAGA